ncbi:uncharacterized protein FOBCDRAFT_259956 [Fusarium oxysporum Fo47]|uniref:uncharacterized protein n=1 Tax=Fusarium oxysporum Fo47 TaxID=660027 RepID=UPI002869B89B|nr:uncharacterized protein FOBCDRAFT_259956 [Fusarium oxysporum Fo47]WJG35181.1 hypothetical protein FOBCDRAFT_259956 [Fusarium oxysporum Fo47]
MPNRYCIRMDTRRVLEPVPRKLAVAFFSASSINMGHLEEFGEVISRWSGNSETFTISAFHLGSRRLMRNRTSGITLRLVESTRSPGSEYLRDQGDRRIKNDSRSSAECHDIGCVTPQPRAHMVHLPNATAKLVRMMCPIWLSVHAYVGVI